MQPVARLLPQSFGDFEWVDVAIDRAPPLGFVTSPMDLPVMGPAKRDSEFVADFAADGSGLRKSQVMSVRRLAIAEQARLRGNKLQVCFVAPPWRVPERQCASILGRQ